jgi:hypothetical protein
MFDSEDGSADVTQAPREPITLSTTRRDVFRSIGAGALGAAFGAGASPAPRKWPRATARSGPAHRRSPASA